MEKNERDVLEELSCMSVIKKSLDSNDSLDLAEKECIKDRIRKEEEEREQEFFKKLKEYGFLV